MKFNKIHKYRAEKAAIEQNHPKINHHIKPKETSMAESMKASQEDTLNNTSRKFRSGLNMQASSYIHSKSITLRDYMYITSKSLKKNPSTNKKIQSTVLQKIEAKDLSKKIDNINTTFIKHKYQTSNQEIFQLVKADINADIIKMLQKAQLVKTTFTDLLQNTRINNEKLMQLYKIRKILKEHILKQLENVQQMMIKSNNDSKRTNFQLYVPESSVDLEKNNHSQKNEKWVGNEQHQIKLINKSSSFSFKN